jgi:hypothetical protein
MFDIWQSFELFTENYMVQFKQVARDERERYQGMSFLCLSILYGG